MDAFLSSRINKSEREAILERFIAPPPKVNLGLEVTGVFGFPEEWKTIDEQFPQCNFTYQINFSGVQVLDGKVIPRQLTEEELKAAEELQAAKSKKPAQSKPKKGEEPPQPSPEELEKKRKLQEEKEEAQRKFQEAWDALDEETKFYRTYEDPYKNSCIKFEHNTASVEKSHEALAELEERVKYDSGEWLYFIKKSNLGDEEMKKVQKSKPKGLNLVELNGITTRAWIDLSVFQQPGQSEQVYRARLDQVLPPDVNPEEHPKPNLKNIYVLFKVTMDPPVTKYLTKPEPKAKELIEKPKPEKKLPPAVEVVKELKAQMIIVMESIAMEYAAMFGKDLNTQLDPRNKQLLNAQKKREGRDQRKEQFLYEFNMSGKYNILREKMKKSLMKIVRDRFGKQGSLTGVTIDSKEDQFYSELHVFLVDEMRKTLTELIQNKKDEMHEELVLTREAALKERDFIVYNVTKESEADKVARLAYEADVIDNVEEAEKNYEALVALDGKNPEIWFQFTKFYLRRGPSNKADEKMAHALTYDPDNRTYQVIMACLLLRKKKGREVLIFLSSILDDDPFNLLVNALCCYTYETVMNDEKLSKKFFAVCRRIVKRKLGIMPGVGEYRQTTEKPKQPTLADLQTDGSKRPSSKEAGAPTAGGKKKTKEEIEREIEELKALEERKIKQQNQLEIDTIWYELLEFLVEYTLTDIAAVIAERIHDQNTERYKLLRSKIAFFNKDSGKAIATINELISKNSGTPLPTIIFFFSIDLDSRNAEYVLTKADYCFAANRLDEAEELFLRSFRIKGVKPSFEAFLKLGEILRLKQVWGDAKAVFAKAWEKKPTSSNAWFGYGMASYKMGEFKDGEEALGQANLYDPLNPDVWGYLALCNLELPDGMVKAYQCIKEMMKLDIKKQDILEDLGDKLTSKKKYELADACYKKIIDGWNAHSSNFIATRGIGYIYAKVGKLYHLQDKMIEAKVNYTEALKFLDDDDEKERIELILSENFNVIIESPMESP